MTKHLTLLLFIGLALGQKQYNIEHIVKQGGVHKKKFSDEIVNGEVFQMYGDMKVPLGKMRNGKREGIWKEWYDNGTIKTQANYLNGKMSGLSIGFNKKGKRVLESKIVDSLNFSVVRYYDDGSKMTEGEYVNGEKFNGTFNTYRKAPPEIRIGKYDERKAIITYKDGNLIEIEWFESNDSENKVVVRVSDCLNTDDCLSEKEKRAKNTIYTDPELVWTSGFLGLIYITEKYQDENVVFLQLLNSGDYPYKSVWLKIYFYRDGNQIYDERVMFSSLEANGKVTETVKLLDEFDKIEVELLKYKDG